MATINPQPSRKQPPAPLSLQEFSVETQVPSRSPHWPQISQWQRKGLVRLAWKETKDFAFVKLTELGRKEVAEAQASGSLAKP